MTDILAASRVQRTLVHHCQILSKWSNCICSCRDMAIFQDGDRPPSWILGSHFRTTQKEYWWLFMIGQDFVGIHSVIFIIWKFHYFVRLPWKCLFTSQNWVLRQFDSLNWEQYQCNPQKAHACVERRRMTYRSSKSVHWCDLCTWLSNLKDKDFFTVVNWVFAQTTHIVGSRCNLAW